LNEPNAMGGAMILPELLCCRCHRHCWSTCR
jgi:hypothetical protein